MNGKLPDPEFMKLIEKLIKEREEKLPDPEFKVLIEKLAIERDARFQPQKEPTQVKLDEDKLRRFILRQMKTLGW